MLSSFAIAFVILIFLGALFESRRNDIKKQNRQIQPPIVPMYYNNGSIAQQPYDITSFHIAGVTFNDGRQSRQTSLRMLKFKDAPMDGPILFEFEQYEYEGRPAVRILANNRVLGNVPADIVDEFIYKMEKYTDYDIDYTVVGGGDVNFGCVMTFTWR